MASTIANVAVARVAQRLPVLRRLPLARLVIIAEVGMLAKSHFERLTAADRRRLVVLVRRAKGRPGNLTAKQRKEFETILLKLEPKMFARSAVEKFVPVSSGKKPASKKA